MTIKQLPVLPVPIVTLVANWNQLGQSGKPLFDPNFFPHQIHPYLHGQEDFYEHSESTILRPFSRTSKDPLAYYILIPSGRI